jgi:hypothetical protein
MFTNETELKEEVRSFTGYTSTTVLSDSSLDTAYRNAQRHITRRKALAADYTWFDTDNLAAQDALYWWTCLFSKVQTGELDAQSLQAGAVDQKELLAKADNEVTTWYRQARDAIQSVKATSIMRVSSPSRTDREYVPGNFTTGGNSGGGSSSDVDAEDL